MKDTVLLTFGCSWTFGEGSGYEDGMTEMQYEKIRENENNILPDAKVMKELMYAYSLGLISLYYNNTDDGDKEQSLNQKEDADCSSGACKL